MKRGEKGILIVIGLTVVLFAGINVFRHSQDEGSDPGIPFYSDASESLQAQGATLYRRLKCRDCHSLWGVRNPMQAVPAPSLDGIGSLRDEAWLYDYLSAESPQDILPSRLKAEYQMPSYAYLPQGEREILAAYLASLKVEDWYLDDVRKAEYEKLTGETYPAQ